jgi:hypothetical protein
MAGQGFISLESGKYKELYSAQTSLGVSSANQIVALNSLGLIDSTMLPPISGGTVTSVAASITGNSLGITGSPITTAGTLAFAFAGTNLQYINGSGNLTTFPSLTGFVPYTGATADLNLGLFDLKTAKVWLYDVPNAGYGSMELTDGVLHFEDVDGHSMVTMEDGYLTIANSSTIRALLNVSGLSANRDYAFPNASGTLALTSDISYPVTSVFGRTGAVVATEGDYSLTQLSDVTITTPSSGQVLRYSGTAWVNSTETYVGTVTSVAMSVPTGLSISGSPITTSGTLAVTLTAGYVIPTTSEETNWNTAYTNRITSATAPLSITSNVISISQSTTSTNGYLSSTDWNTFNNKLSGNQTITLSSEASGSGATSIAVTLSNSAVIGKVLTGYVSGAGTVSATDSILSAIQKLNGNIASIVGGVSSVSGTTNRITTSPTTGAVVVDISASYVGQSSITTLGTITTGTWNGTAIADAYIASATNWNTAYTNRITSLTTTGSSGAATLTSNTLNIPNYTIDGILPNQSGNSGKYLTTNGTNASWATVSASPAGSTTQVQYNLSGAFAGSANMIFDGNKLTTNQFSVTGSRTLAAWGTSGISLATVASTYTDSSTAAGATVSAISGVSFGKPTFTAANATAGSKVTYTQAISNYFAGKAQLGANTLATYQWNAFFDSGSNSGATDDVAVAGRLFVGQNLAYASSAYQDALNVVGFVQNYGGQWGIDFIGAGNALLPNQGIFARLRASIQSSTPGYSFFDIMLSTNSSHNAAQTYIRCSSGYTSGGNVGYQFVQNYYATYFGSTETAPTALVHIQGSTTSTASLRVLSGTAPTSPNNGDMWNDSTQKSFYHYCNGLKENISTVAFTQTTTTTVANTTTETSILGTGVGTKTLPAAFLVAGKTVRVRIEGYVSNLATPTIQIKIKLGATIILDTTAVTMTTITGSMRFKVEGTLTCRTTGASGTIFSQGDVKYFSIASTANNIDMVNTTTTTIDTTASQAIDVTCTWGTANASNTISSTNTTIEILN